uniref:Uncharacterized protein n=1 Tax=Nelumbo nucifera TaxID=4432 RepID=A0A822ZPB1_NELNU|nr:TPA_asm: hypothetical protein HUJ06_003601 [Nelumbo nucifera]
MAKLFCCFFLVLLVFSVASMLPSSDAANGGTCVEVLPTMQVCDPIGCSYWCVQNWNGRGICHDPHNCVCVHC